VTNAKKATNARVRQAERPDLADSARLHAPDPAEPARLHAPVLPVSSLARWGSGR
jgi:hypothetical protein